MRINNNLMAMNTHRQLGIATNAGAKSMEKLSSGYRINKAGDDAAGLSISEKMRNQVRGLGRASANAQDGISLIQTAEGALDEIHSILKRGRELVVQAGNLGTLQKEDLEAIDDEFQALSKEITAIGKRTQFNGKNLFDGEYNGQFQIGANKEQNMELTIKLEVKEITGTTMPIAPTSEEGGTGGTEETEESKEALSANNLFLDKVVIKEADAESAAQPIADATTPESKEVDKNLEIMDNAIGAISKMRSHLGANQNRLEHTIKNLDNAGENLQAAESRIRDVDMAKEMMENTKQNILQQASTAMLAQANQAPQNILTLLR